MEELGVGRRPAVLRFQGLGTGPLEGSPVAGPGLATFHQEEDDDRMDAHIPLNGPWGEEAEQEEFRGG